MPSLLHESLKWWDSPYINHFLQPDAIVPNPASPQSWNRYSYVGNNPVGYSDPTGHIRVDGCTELAGGCSVTQQTIDNDLKKAEEFRQTTNANKCKKGNKLYCSYAENHPVETAAFVTTGLIGGPLVGEFVLGGGLAAFMASSFFLPTIANGALGGAVSGAAYVAVSILNGRSITGGGLAGAIATGVIAGIVGMGATPLAGSLLHGLGLSATGLNVGVGSFLVNGLGGLAAYHTGGAVNNIVDMSVGQEPSFTPTRNGNIVSFAAPAILSSIASSNLPVKNINTLNQANSFVPGRSVNTVFQNNNLYQQTIYTSIAGVVYGDSLGGDQ